MERTKNENATFTYTGAKRKYQTWRSLFSNPEVYYKSDKRSTCHNNALARGSRAYPYNKRFLYLPDRFSWIWGKYRGYPVYSSPAAAFHYPEKQSGLLFGNLCIPYESFGRKYCRHLFYPLPYAYGKPRIIFTLSHYRGSSCIWFSLQVFCTACLPLRYPDVWIGTRHKILSAADTFSSAPVQ